MWSKYLDLNDINYIERVCEKAMELWGYKKLFYSTSNSHILNPLYNAHEEVYKRVCTCLTFILEIIIIDG